MLTGLGLVHEDVRCWLGLGLLDVNQMIIETFSFCSDQNHNHCLKSQARNMGVCRQVVFEMRHPFPIHWFAFASSFVGVLLFQLFVGSAPSSVTQSGFMAGSLLRKRIKVSERKTCCSFWLFSFETSRFRTRRAQVRRDDTGGML